MAIFSGLPQGALDLLKRQEEARAANEARPPLPYTLGFRTPISYLWAGKPTAAPTGNAPMTPGGMSTADSGMNNAGVSLRALMERERGAATEAPVVKDLQYWLDQVRGQDTTDYAGLQGDYEDVAAKAKNRIAAMYRSLQGERRATEDLYTGYRDTAAQNITKSSDEAAADIAAAYNNAYETQANMAAQLGIDTPLAGFDMANMADTAGANQSLAEQLGQIYGGANELGRASDLAYNQDMIGAAGFGSREAQAGIEASLAQRLAELSAARSSQGGLANLLPLAQQMQQFDASLTPGLTFDQQLKLDDIAYNRGLDAQQAQDAMLSMLIKDAGMDYQTALETVNSRYGIQ